MKVKDAHKQRVKKLEENKTMKECAGYYTRRRRKIEYVKKDIAEVRTVHVLAS